MASRGAAVVLTYNGIDGACAAAALLLQHPDAEVLPTSAARVGEAMAGLASRCPRSAAVHVCGLGVYCDWQEVLRPASLLARKDISLTWYCGRGYLEPQRERFEAFCEPVFHDAGTNTAAVCRHIGLEGDARAARLVALARHDPNVEGDDGEAGECQELWLDLVNAAIADYFKYQDTAAYVEAVHRLAQGELKPADRRKVAVFRRSGFKHVLWGKSKAMARLRDIIRRCAEADEPVLILGESGVGKEYVAHLVHERSKRAMDPFVPVNCGLFAGNAGLADSTLFGHVKGAFTGALRNREGAFGAADSGILFLDELGELPADVQAKFLRVVEDGWVTPVGADTPRRVDVSVIAATNRDLPGLVRCGAFRDDLYHRLDVLRIHVPPLRQHIEDVPEIVTHVLPSLQGAADFQPTDADLHALQQYGWPGNVRQLIKVLKRALCLERSIPDVLAEERRSALGAQASQQEGIPWPETPGAVRPIREVRDRYAARALELHDGNWTRTAKILGIAVNTLRSYVEHE